MILASLAVIYVNTEETKAAGEQALDQTYQVFTISDEQSAATSLGLGCMKCLTGYMMLASTMLLGFLGGQMFVVAINKYRLEIDQISFYFAMYNFAVVGTTAVFYQKGIPVWINQAYLVATSVIVAWQLSYFNAWMAWALLIMLALYDLCAVLTPCGPLKALVKQMSKEDAPGMPGLMYEAGVPVSRPAGLRRKKNEGRKDETGADVEQTSSPAGGTGDAAASNGDSFGENSGSENVPPEESARRRRKDQRNDGRSLPSEAQRDAGPAGDRATRRNTSASPQETSASTADAPRRTVPLAIAMVYKLPLASPGSSGRNVAVDGSSPTAYLHQEFGAVELRSDVEVTLPRNGGRIDATRNKKGEPRYVVYDKDGEVKRTLLVDERGKVLEIVPREEDDGEPEPGDIKLGLGDFIFYSVLVSKAAEDGFAAFAVCFLAILVGLGGTLILLAFFHKALPALPISIFLAVIGFVLTMYCIEPMIQNMWQAGPFYV
ncbi:hypothetical protein ACHAWF_014606 [Thalassiosira exigua]